MKLSILIIILIFCLPIVVDAGYRDPFESVLPEPVDERRVTPAREAAIRDLPRWIALEGVIWGTDLPQAIISGQVYFVGDSIKGIDATITEIRNNVVFISFGDRVFRLTTQGVR